MIQLLITTILVVISSWPVWGWAGEDYATVEQGGQIWVIGKWTSSEGEHCIEWTTLKGGIQKTCQPTCEQRMREAMKAANPYLVPPGDSGIRLAIPDYCFELCQAERRVEEIKKKNAVMNQWGTTYKDCVEGGK